MTRKASKILALEVAAPDDMGDAEDEGSREQLRAVLREIPVLTPWTAHVAHDPTFSHELNVELAARVQELIFDELERCLVRLKKHQEESDTAGIMDKRATRTLLENRLVVEAKRKIDVQQISHDMRTAMKTAIAMVNSPGFASRHVPSPGKTSRPMSLLGQLMSEKEAEKNAALLTTTEGTATVKSQRRNASKLDDPSQRRPEEKEQHHGPLYVEFPPSPPKLSDLVAQADENLTTEDLDNQVTNFRQRPVASTAVGDAGSPVYRRDARPDRVRYIMSTRMGALPPTKNILEEYPIPKEILDALETHRHYHIDESSLMSSFDSIKAGSTGDWECYFRRSVPLERKPVSFVLSSLEIANERPVPPPSDIFQHHLVESATNEDVMLTQVQQLYDHTHESYRDFRGSLHRHLDLPYLVDLSLRSSLNSTSYFLEEELVSTEPTVQIPERLYRKAHSLVSKWRLAKKGATGRMTTRRGAIALQVKVEMSKAQRNEMLAKICHFTPNEVQLMDLWHSYDADADETTPFDPIPMRPDLSNCFDVVWKDLSMPAKERLDLAIKYSSLDNSSRLPDAVALWQVTAALIKEREELLRLVRTAIATPKKTVAMISEEMALLQDLALTTTHVKEALLLTYIEVGDFVTLGGNFYLIKMEHEATELQQSIVESMEAAKRRSTPEEDAMASLSAFVGSAGAAASQAGDRDTIHRDTWV